MDRILQYRKDKTEKEVIRDHFFNSVFFLWTIRGPLSKSSVFINDIAVADCFQFNAKKKGLQLQKQKEWNMEDQKSSTLYSSKMSIKTGNAVQ